MTSNSGLAKLGPVTSGAAPSMDAGLGAAAFGAAVDGGMAWFDIALRFQREMRRASLRSLSAYGPSGDAGTAGEAAPRRSEDVQVIAVGEERLNVAASTVQGETVRVRRRVVSRPVTREVVLRDEKVVVERRAPAGGETAGEPDVLTETVVEMSDSRQVPKVWKSLHVAEEVVLRRQVTERTERVRGTVRHDVVDVEQPRLAVAAAAQVALPAPAAARKD